MEERYLRQAELVVRCIPSIEPCFALKGGTAINLFELNMPRLSVDIDLTFLPVTDRETACCVHRAGSGRRRVWDSGTGDASRHPLEAQEPGNAAPEGRPKIRRQRGGVEINPSHRQMNKCATSSTHWIAMKRSSMARRSIYASLREICCCPANDCKLLRQCRKNDRMARLSNGTAMPEKGDLT